MPIWLEPLLKIFRKPEKKKLNGVLRCCECGASNATLRKVWKRVPGYKYIYEENPVYVCNKCFYKKGRPQ